MWALNFGLTGLQTETTSLKDIVNTLPGVFLIYVSITSLIAINNVYKTAEPVDKVRIRWLFGFVITSYLLTTFLYAFYFTLSDMELVSGDTKAFLGAVIPQISIVTGTFIFLKIYATSKRVTFL